MLDLGLDVLLKGNNMIRLLQGLWVALWISLVSVIISMPLGILLGKNVALERMGTLDLAVLGEIESLFRATVRFQFGHCIGSFLGLLTSYYWCSAPWATGT